jgi:hypothetical protein
MEQLVTLITNYWFQRSALIEEMYTVPEGKTKAELGDVICSTTGNTR